MLKFAKPVLITLSISTFALLCLATCKGGEVEEDGDSAYYCSDSSECSARERCVITPNIFGGKGRCSPCSCADTNDCAADQLCLADCYCLEKGYSICDESICPDRNLCIWTENSTYGLAESCIPLPPEDEQED